MIAVAFVVDHDKNSMNLRLTLGWKLLERMGQDGGCTGPLPPGQPICKNVGLT